MKASANTVAFDMAVLYLLCRLGSWPGVKAADLEAARKALLNAPLQGGPAKLAEMAASGMPQAVVPFERDPLDVACAAHMAEICKLCELAGEGLHVDAGYFSLRGNEVSYVDDVSEYHSTNTRLLDPPALQVLLHQLRTRPSRPARYWVSGEDDGPGAPPGEVLRVIGSWVAPCVIPLQAPKVTLRLLNPRHPSRGAVTLCDVECTPHRSDLVLNRMRPEWLMELQAAALDGAWLQMEHTRFSCIGPLPDLLEPGDGRDIWWHPAGAFQEGMGALPLATVQLDTTIAQRIVQHVPWAWLPRASEHFAAATGLGLASAALPVPAC